MSDCSKHKPTVEKYDGDLKSLAEDIGDLRYDSLSEFLGYLSEKLKKDGHKDWDGKRTQLAASLLNASVNTDKLKENIDLAWKISEPYMK